MLHVCLDYEEIHSHIFVYHGLLKDHAELTEIVKLSEQQSKGKYYLHDWTPWFTFGTYTYQKNPYDDVDKTGPMSSKERRLCQRINEANNSALSHYVGKNDIELPEGSYITTPNYAKYVPGGFFGIQEGGNDDGSDRLLSMNYHTDYAIGEWYWPHDKFFITCTAYINDDYDGGELRFFVDGNTVAYKPRAGDVVVFPSGSPLYPGTHPYFHAVGQVLNGNKFLTRTYIKHPGQMTEEWLNGEKEYGKDEWPEIAKKLIKEDNTIHFHDDILKVEKKYKNMSIWESPLVSKLYKNS
jgi:hypothetical protein